MASGTINLNNSSQTSGGGYLMGKIEWSSTTDNEANKSSVTAKLYVKKASSTGTITDPTTGNWDCSLTINGSNTSKLVSASVTADWVLVLTSTVSVPHNNDGSRSITIEASIYGPSGTAYSGLKTSGKGTATLDTIPRASTIGATDANIGSTSMIAVSRKSSGYTHSISYKFGTLSGYITSSGGTSGTESKFTETSIAFTVPTSFYAQIPNDKTGTCTLTIKTYSGTTQIGNAQTCTFIATASESSCRPSVSGTVVDSNDVTKKLTGNEEKLVRYYSTALCTITATAKNSSKIVSRTINGVAVSKTSMSIPNVESGDVTFSATDSRGYSSSVTVNATVIRYVKLTNNATGVRTDPTSGNATLKFKGNYSNGSFGAVNNTLKIKYRIGDGEYVSVTPTIDGNTYSAIANLTGLDYAHAYTIETVVTDKLASISKNVIIGKGIPVFDWGETDMNIHVPLMVDGWPVPSCKLLLERSSGWPSGESVDIPELVGCDAALIFYCAGTSWGPGVLRHVLIPVGFSGTLESIVNMTSSSVMSICQRNIAVGNGSVTTGAVWIKPVNSSAAAADNTSYPYALSPYRIYGLKW